MEYLNITRVIWLSVSVFCVFMALMGSDNIGDRKGNCEITNVTYPVSFKDTEGWIGCPCFTEFCVAMCYCVKLISNNTMISYYPYEFDCTFKSNVIPYDLNFSNIVDKYNNKVLDCWYNDDYDTYYINGKIMKNYSKTIFVSLFFIFLIVCIIIESTSSSSTVILRDDEEESILPSYESSSSIPPSYEV